MEEEKVSRKLEQLKNRLKDSGALTNLLALENKNAQMTSLLVSAQEVDKIWKSALSRLPSEKELVAGTLCGLQTFQYYLNIASVESYHNISELQKTLKITASSLAQKMPHLLRELKINEINEIECRALKFFLKKQSEVLIPLSSLRIIDALRNLTILLPENLSQIDGLLSSMRLIQEYSSLVQEQYKRILTISNYQSCVNRLKLIEIVTNLVQEQISIIGDSSISKTIEEDEYKDNSNIKTVVSYIPSYLGYALRKDVQYDLDEEFAKSTTCKAVEGGKNIIKKIEYINEISMVKSSKGEFLFKPTNKTYSAVSCLSTAFCVNEESFGGVVDSLYQLLYEGSGSAGRLLKVVGDEECSALWDIKNLRTDFRHDIEHGDEKKYLKKKQEIAKVYENICGKIRPNKQKDWVTAQLNLFDKVNNFLDLIVEKLSNTTKL